MIAAIVIMTAGVAFASGFVVGGLPHVPTFYRSHQYPAAVLLEKVRDRRADISAVLRRA